MPKNLDSPIEWFFLFLLVVMLVVMAAVISNAEQGLKDPNDKERVYLDQLPSLALLSGLGPFLVRIRTQNKGLHSELQAPTASAAVSQAITTFRRGRIDAIRISRNTADELHFNRLFYGHRRSNQGRKVAWVEITRIG
jgi:hypothetical protein